MTGFVVIHGMCCACSSFMMFNPNKVPSVRINGVKQPLCKACVDKVNAKRALIGMPPFKIEPGAYEAASEDEIKWD